MPIVDSEKRELARRHRLYYMICRQCGARNPWKATRCRKCRGKNLREKKRDIAHV